MKFILLNLSCSISDYAESFNTSLIPHILISVLIGNKNIKYNYLSCPLDDPGDPRILRLNLLGLLLLGAPNRLVLFVGLQPGSLVEGSKTSGVFMVGVLVVGLVVFCSRLKLHE